MFITSGCPEKKVTEGETLIYVQAKCRLLHTMQLWPNVHRGNGKMP